MYVLFPFEWHNEEKHCIDNARMARPVIWRLQSCSYNAIVAIWKLSRLSQEGVKQLPALPALTGSLLLTLLQTGSAASIAVRQEDVHLNLSFASGASKQTTQILEMRVSGPQHWG